MNMLFLSFITFIVCTSYNDSWEDRYPLGDEDEYDQLPQYKGQINPGSRSGSTAFYIGNYFYLFGGILTVNDENNGFRNDLFKFDDLNKKWFHVSGENEYNSLGSNDIPYNFSKKNVPAARYLGMGIEDFQNEKLIHLFGLFQNYSVVNTTGSDGKEYIFNVYSDYDSIYNDVWVYSINEPSGWKMIKNNTKVEKITENDYNELNVPKGRGDSCFARIDDEQVIIFGGKTVNYDGHFAQSNGVKSYLNDLWLFNITDYQFFPFWSANNASANFSFEDYDEKNVIPARSEHACWYDKGKSEFYVFGGYISYIENMTNINMTNINMTNINMTNINMTIQYTPTLKEGRANDLWVFNMENWKPIKIPQFDTRSHIEQYGVFANNRISSRSGSCYSMTFNNRLVIFGGFGWKTQYDDILPDKLTDIWYYDSTFDQFMIESNQEDLPPAIFPVCKENEEKVIMLFGGSRQFGVSNRLQKYKKLSTPCRGWASEEKNQTTNETIGCNCSKDYFYLDQNKEINKEINNWLFSNVSDDFECSYFRCGGILRSDSNVCSGHGVCISPNKCECDEGWESSNCSVVTCFDLPYYDNNVCSGHGTCIGYNECSCDDDYINGSICLEKLGQVVMEDFNRNQRDDYYKNHFDRNETEINGKEKTLKIKYELDKQYVSHSGIECKKLFKNYDILGNKLYPNLFKDDITEWKDGICTFIFDESSQKTIQIKITAQPYSIVNFSSSLIFLPIIDSEKNRGDINYEKFIEIDTNDDKSDKGNNDYTLFIVIAAISVCVLLTISAFLLSFVTLILCRVLYVDQQKKKEIKEYFEMELEDNDPTNPLNKVKFKKEMLEIDYDDLKIGKKIAKGGGMATIFTAKWKGSDVVFKCFRVSDLSDDDDFLEFEKEVMLLASLSHPNVLKFFGTCLKQTRVGIVIEYCRNGSLKDYLSKPNVLMPYKQKVKIFHESCSALDYLHSRNVIHRDIKSDNILLGDNLEAKLIDFGVSRIFTDKNVEVTKRVGTSVYMAPEMVTQADTKYDEKVDIFSMAIVIYEVLVVDFNPYGLENNFNVEYRVAIDPKFRPDISKIEGGDKQFWVNILNKMWSHNPEERPSAEELCEQFNEKLQ